MSKSVVGRILAMLVLALSVAATSQAAIGDKEADVSLGVNSASIGSGAGYGITVGGGIEKYEGFLALKGSTVQLRSDLSYNHWSASLSYGDWAYSRITPSVGARLYVPIAAVPNLRAFGGADLALSFFSVSSGTYSSGSAMNFGIPLSIGADYKIKDNLFATGEVKFGLMSDGYGSGQVGVAYRF